MRRASLPPAFLHTRHSNLAPHLQLVLGVEEVQRCLAGYSQASAGHAEARQEHGNAPPCTSASLCTTMVRDEQA